MKLNSSKFTKFYHAFLHSLRLLQTHGPLLLSVLLIILLFSVLYSQSYDDYQKCTDANSFGTCGDFFSNFVHELYYNAIAYEPRIEKTSFGWFLIPIYGILYPYRTGLDLLKNITETISPLFVIFGFAPTVLENFGEFFKTFQKEYPTTIQIGWNIFVRQADGRLKLNMIPEAEMELPELFLNDAYRRDLVLDEILKTEDFIVDLEGDLRDETYRRIRNKISLAIKASRWLLFAQEHKNFNRNIREPALFLITYEVSAQVTNPRVWLIFPEELRMMLQYKGMSVEELRNHFNLEIDHWSLRIQNLIKWAVIYFEENKTKVSDKVELPILDTDLLPPEQQINHHATNNTRKNRKKSKSKKSN